MAGTDTSSSKPRRRWFQFSLRALLVTVTVLGLGLVPLAVRLKRERDKQVAMTRLQEMGVWVESFNDEIMVVVRSNVEVTDEIRTYLKSLRGVTWLHLCGYTVTDDTLRRLNDF